MSFTIRVGICRLLGVMALCALECQTSATLLAATPFTPGNLVVTQVDQLREYTRSGLLVQTISVPHPESPPLVRQNVAGVVFGPNGQVEVANFASAGFHSYLSTYDPATGGWQHQLNLNTGTTGLTSLADGDLARYNNLVIMYGYAFDLANPSSSSLLPNSVFPPGRGGSGISIGLNGLMYVVDAGSPQEEVRVTNPANNYSFVRELSLLDAQGVRRQITGLAAATDGTIFAADLNGMIYKYSATGTLLGQTPTGASNLESLELSSDGTLVAGSRFGDVVITNTNLSIPTLFSVGNSDTYVNFVPVPEPGTLTLLSGCSFFAAVCWWRGRKRRCEGK